MQTLERATALLRGAISFDGLAKILHELGFSERPLPLDERALHALGLPANLGRTHICKGDGDLRGLSIELDSLSDAREALSSVARALARNASQFLWIVVATRRSTSEVAIVCWRSIGARTRVVSVLARSDNPHQSDAETLCTLAAVRGESDLLTHARWLDVLGRESITSRFFRTLNQTIHDLSDSLTGQLDLGEKRELALLYVSRLIFLSFLESKGWLNGDFSFLSNGYTRCVERGGGYQRAVLAPLFFGTLNTAVRARSLRAREFGRVPFLNGGLFSRSHLEKRSRSSVFSDDSFGNAYGSLLSHYRFSGREDSSEWSEASIDPEILGKAFEALMGPADRKTSGAFYTPQDLVDDLASHAVSSAFRHSQGEAGRLDALRQVRVLDPACGSGAFLVHMLERLAVLRRESGEPGSVAEIRRRVLMTSIFGVDLSPMAVWLCELRLWLSIVIESEERDPMRITPLPNLDRHIRVGDSLAGGAFDDRGSLAISRNLASLRNRYARAAGPRKRTLARALDRLERSAAIDSFMRKRVRLTVERKEMLIHLRARDLFGDRHPPDQQTRIRLTGIRRGLRESADKVKSLRSGAALPFSFSAQFSDIAATGGFDIVVGNPPWVRVHRIAESSRQRLKQDFTVYRQAAWEAGAKSAGAGHGFAAQIDLAALFVERACDLLRPGGTLAFLLPAKLWRSLAGGGVRQLLLERADVVLLEDIANSGSQFEAAVYPSLLVARRRIENAGAITDKVIPTVEAEAEWINVTIRTPRGTKRWSCHPHRLSVDGTPGSPWLLLPGTVRRAFDRITRSGIPFSHTRFGRPLLGVKTGCNNAYIVRVDSVDGEIAHISRDGRTGEIEREMLRPLVRGETLDQWRLSGGGEYLIWPYREDGTSRSELPPRARRWLSSYRGALTRRTDLHDRRAWWSLFRTESANNESPRVIWADFGLRPRSIVVAADERFVALNTCYVVRCRRNSDAHALAAILNGPLAAAWLNAIAEPARGGYRRYLGWTMSLLPLPLRWNRARKLLSPLGERAMQGDIPSDDELLFAALEAYQIDRAKVEALLSWGPDCG